MKTHSSLPSTRLLLLGCSLFLLSACTPVLTSGSSTAAPSYALKQQFAQLQQQQQQQAEQLQALQQQLNQLLQQPVETPLATDPVDQIFTPEVDVAAIEPITIPAVMGQELVELADSAASYLAAFSDLAAGRYVVAETGFNNFLNKYPQHQYSPNARYWLASAQLSQGKSQLASSNLRQVIVDNKGQDRAPAALILLAKAYQQQQMPAEAEEVFDQLRIRYPKSSEAQQLFRTTEAQ